MEIKTLLNEYAYDWAAFPACQEDFPAEKLKNKSVLITGGHLNFARCVLLSILASNDLKDTNISVSFLADEEYIDEIPDGIIGRDDFRYYVFGVEPQSLPRVDVVISTGLCNMAVGEDTHFIKESLNAMKYIISVVEETGAQQLVLFSDYRVYGKTERGVLMSEYENGRVSFSRSAAEASILLQAMEAQCVAAAKSAEFDFTILRCAIMLGASAGLDDSIISDMLKSAAVGDEYSVINSNSKYSFVYLSDVLSSMYHAIADMRKNTCYNVVGKDSTVSTGMLAAMLHDLYPDSTKINLINSENDPAYGASMNNQKITVFGGCEPQISLLDAVQLVVRSYRHDNELFKFDDSYQGKIKSIQNILLLYLLEIDRICRKHHIKYFLAGGTLLGAIRHKGFIPWDDDADVMMLREDYNKFLNIVQSELPSNISLHTHDTDPKTHCIFTKLRIDNTMFATRWTSKFPDMHNGVFFDVLAHDQTANSKIGRKLHLNLTLMTRSLVFNKWHDRKVDNGHKFQSAVTDIIKKLLPLSILDKLQFKCLRWLENKKDARYLYDGMGRNVYNGDFPKKWLKDTVYWDFEGYRFPVPKDYDKYLRYLYGDYNSLVLASERKTSHDIVVMDLGEYCCAKRPEHTYHQISIAQPISPPSEPPKKYPKRSEAAIYSEEDKTADAADKLQQPDALTDDVKVFVPKKERKKADDKPEQNQLPPSDNPPDGSSEETVDADKEPKGKQQAVDKTATEPEKPSDPALYETVEFTMHQTDISHYTMSITDKKPEDTKEFEIVAPDGINEDSKS